MANLINLVGQKFNKLEVKSFYGKVKKSYYWMCQCDCGNLKKAESGNLKSGKTKSCGCHRREAVENKITSLVGRKFGRLEVKGFLEKEGKCYYWMCQCDCGNLKKVEGSSLKTGTTRSCGCLRTELMHKHVSLVGEKFGKLEVKSLHKIKRRRYYWDCQCECGTAVVVEGNHLKVGHTKSCGCLRSEVLISRNTTHGLCKNKRILKEMSRLRSLIDRCYNPRNVAYKNYGGRGIFVCDEWLNDSKSFFDWALSSGYQEGLTLERRNNNGPYSPDNCRWATRKEQANNTRKNKLITYKGETKTVAEWSHVLNINYHTLQKRLHSNWSEDRIFTEQVNKDKSHT